MALAGRAWLEEAEWERAFTRCFRSDVKLFGLALQELERHKTRVRPRKFVEDTAKKIGMGLMQHFTPKSVDKELIPSEKEISKLLQSYEAAALGVETVPKLTF